MLALMRVDTVKAMVGGRSSCVVFNLADQHVDFTNKFKHEKIFPASKVFDFAAWRRDHDTYMTAEERCDKFGRKKDKFVGSSTTMTPLSACLSFGKSSHRSIARRRL